MTWKLITYSGLGLLLMGLILEASTGDSIWSALQATGFILALPWAVFGKD